MVVPDRSVSERGGLPYVAAPFTPSHRHLPHSSNLFVSRVRHHSCVMYGIRTSCNATGIVHCSHMPQSNVKHANSLRVAYAKCEGVMPDFFGFG